MACNCTARKYRYTLGQPRVGTNFVMYPTCKDVNILAQYGMVEVIFPAVSTSSLQVSILDCNTNTLVYQSDGKPLTGTNVPVNTPITLSFSSQVGGYVATNFPASSTTTSAESVATDDTSSDSNVNGGGNTSNTGGNS